MLLILLETPALIDELIEPVIILLSPTKTPHELLGYLILLNPPAPIIELLLPEIELLIPPTIC